MRELLEKLYNSLDEVFRDKISNKDKYFFFNDTIDVLATFVALSKTEKALREIMESSSISKDSLKYQFGKVSFEEARDSRYILKGKGVKDHMYFISTLGLYFIYQEKGIDLSPVFKALDNHKFPTKKLKLKTQEKIWSVFLILFGADSEINSLDTSTIGPHKLDEYFSFLKMIERDINAKEIKIGKKIQWDRGKDANFRKFITNTTDLPKTGIYHYPNKRYWLDLNKRRNVTYLIDLILDDYDEVDKILVKETLYDVLWDLSNKMLTELGVIPKVLNGFLEEELKS